MRKKSNLEIKITKEVFGFKLQIFKAKYFLSECQSLNYTSELLIMHSGY